MVLVFSFVCLFVFFHFARCIKPSVLELVLAAEPNGKKQHLQGTGSLAAVTSIGLLSHIVAKKRNLSSEEYKMVSTQDIMRSALGKWRPS